MMGVSRFESMRKILEGWSRDKVPIHAAALAYYTVFSIAPLLVIAISVTGFFFGDKASQGRIYGEIQALIGPGGASTVQTMVQNAAAERHSGVIATLLGVLTLLLGAAGVFQQLQESLNLIWNVKAPTGEGIRAWLRRRIFTLAMVGVISFLLLVSLVASALISAAGKFLGTSAIWQFVNLGVSIALVSALFASVYKFLPDVRMRWRDLWFGSFVTAVLFSVGKLVISLYIARTSVSSSYGAAGSLVVLLMWTYYSAMIFFLGAEIIKAAVFRKNVVPEAKPGAVIQKIAA